ncbi:ATP-dependent metallopeptidase FtsH/Yme1/Tma family protein [bacterium]|nr:ATP-dependent metallopeptidase FtsH/Yme1/Tma family protein [bacterium]
MASWRLLKNSDETEVYDLPFSEFSRFINEKKIKEIEIGDDWISGKFKEQEVFPITRGKKTEFKPYEEFRTRRNVDPYYQLQQKLEENEIPYDIKAQSRFPQMISLLGGILLPIILFVGIMYFISRQMQGTGNRALSFGKSRARMHSDNQPKKTFADVAGCDEAKEDLQEIIAFLLEPKKFQRLGGRIPKGVLLMGPPGTGKTSLARAVAGEAGRPFFSISGSEFVEMFVGVGASRVRDLFETGRKNAPCIIFIDELDAVGRHRGAGIGGGHDEREQTLNELLSQMDGFDTSEGVVLVSATNRPDVLDPALLRPGRFDRRIVVDLPDVRGREQIFKVYLKKVKGDPDIDVKTLAKGTPYFSGADIENMVNEAALMAAKQDKESVDMACFEESKDRVMMGPERKSMVISPREKKITAYHESGHALAQHLLPDSDPNYKCSIIPRGTALGVTQKMPMEERHNYGENYLLAEIIVLLSGRAAEMLILGEPTTGSKNDFERATDIVRKMVCEFGMSDLGPIAFGKREEQIFLGKELAQHKDYSEQTALEIDEAIKDIIHKCYQQAESIIGNNVDKLKRLTEQLLEKEVLNGEEIEEILGPRPEAAKVLNDENSSLSS